MKIKLRTIKLKSALSFISALLFLGCGSGITIAASSVAPTSSTSTAGSSATGSGTSSTGSTSSTSASSGTTYTWLAPSIGSTNTMGTIQAQSAGGTLQIVSPQIHAGGTLKVLSVSAPSAVPGQTLTELFAFGNITMQVSIAVNSSGNRLIAVIDANKGLTTSVDLGTWYVNAGGRAMTVPYYSNSFYYLSSSQMFANAWWDWHNSNSATANANALGYQARSDGVRNNLHEELDVVVSPTLADVLPPIGNTPSPYLAQLAGRAVLDIWDDTSFSEINDGITNLSSYGLNNCVDLIHVWQNKGYDNALPGHFPANTSLGGNEALQQTIQTAKQSGCLVGLHQNYMDYYPNYAKFDATALAIDMHGNTIPTWLNSEGVQAHQTKPTRMVANAQTQSPEIHSTLGTNAAFLDVSSALNPWARTDFDASISGAAMIKTWVANVAGLWNFERNTESGPVFGEGGQHWYYSGMLDGVEAQLGEGSGNVAINQGERLPLFVDFDLLRIHPLQANHGMGYYDRWNSTNSLLMTSAQMDQYRMQEVAYGHAPFVGRSYWSDVVHAFQEIKLVGPVAANYGTANATSIQYQVNGSWVSSSAAAIANTFNRVQVGYDSGVTIFANSQASALVEDNVTLPQYGWLAKSSTLTAFTAQCGTSICDYAETPTSLFANARNQLQFAAAYGYAAPSVYSFKQTGFRTFSIGYEWDSNKVFSSSYEPFVHFVNDQQMSVNSGIEFQSDYSFPVSTTTWPVGEVTKSAPIQVQLPSSLPDGTYSVRAGLWNLGNHGRVPLAGTDDGTLRIILGHLVVSHGGATITYTPTPNVADPRMNSDSHVVSFPTIQTDGLVSIDQEKGQWVLRSYPIGKLSTIRLSTSKFAAPASVLSSGSGTEQSVTSTSSGYWEVPLDGSATYSWPVQ